MSSTKPFLNLLSYIASVGLSLACCTDFRDPQEMWTRTCDALVAKSWLDWREGPKTALCRALDTPVIKFQFRLPSVFLRLSQFFDPRLYLVYCVKHVTIEDLNIAFSGDVSSDARCVVRLCLELPSHTGSRQVPAGKRANRTTASR